MGTIRLFAFLIMVRKVLLSGIKKDLGAFDHDLSWFLQRLIIAFTIFFCFIISCHFAVEMGLVGLFVITQNHRMVGVGRDLCGSSSPTLLPKQGHLQ